VRPETLAALQRLSADVTDVIDRLLAYLGEDSAADVSDAEAASEIELVLRTVANELQGIKASLAELRATAFPTEMWNSMNTAWKYLNDEISPTRRESGLLWFSQPEFLKLNGAVRGYSPQAVDSIIGHLEQMAEQVVTYSETPSAHHRSAPGEPAQIDASLWKHDLAMFLELDDLRSVSDRFANLTREQEILRSAAYGIVLNPFQWIDTYVCPSGDRPVPEGSRNQPG
jgi:hypothetical protein